MNLLVLFVFYLNSGRYWFYSIFIYGLYFIFYWILAAKVDHLERVGLVCTDGHKGVVAMFELACIGGCKGAVVMGYVRGM